ncbi:MAG: UDP-N-acetylmuramoyl-tripeptide--D-alanyl-D-alanine ligase [Clostridia bacterium]|nr:UDP-N-acetylmuramoyl-tripeptide--D-alanyl-D-alanine ligase [Clostridia bacterium]
MGSEVFRNGTAVAEAAGGRLCGQCGPIQSVVIDDREAGPGALYVPIIGERLDGHAFIERAFTRGAALTLADRPLASGRPYVLVDDTLDALQKLAGRWKAHYGPFTVAVTGSVGKTSTKEMIASVLAEGLHVLKTQGNLNNQTGVPKTVFRMDDTVEAAVIEMGMNHAGEIDRLARIAVPDVGVITNIGTAHIEYLGSQEGIFAAKTEMLAHLAPAGVALVNGDDPFLQRLARGESGFPSRRVLTYGFSPDLDVYADEITDNGLAGSTATLHLQNGDSLRAEIPVPGRYMIGSALVGAACGVLAGLSAEQIRAGIAAYRPAGSRMRLIEKAELRIIDDTYNANAPAMKEALAVLAQAPGRRIAVLGDMRELGSESERLHREVGETTRELAIDALYTVGLQAAAIRDGAGSVPGNAFRTQDELIAALAGIVRPGDTVLVKGSRGMALEHTVAALGELVF